MVDVTAVFAGLASGDLGTTRSVGGKEEREEGQKRYVYTSPHLVLKTCSFCRWGYLRPVRDDRILHSWGLEVFDNEDAARARHVPFEHRYR